jgi:hypothetical protein
MHHGCGKGMGNLCGPGEAHGSAAQAGNRARATRPGGFSSPPARRVRISGLPGGGCPKRLHSLSKNLTTIQGVNPPSR